MATTKKAPAKKTATKAKKQHDPIEKKPVAEQLELPNKPEPVKPAHETEDMVSYVIPKDPAFEANDQFFEYNLNGITYRFKRGEVLTHPRSFYESVSNKLRKRERISPEIAEYENKSKKLNA